LGASGAGPLGQRSWSRGEGMSQSEAGRRQLEAGEASHVLPNTRVQRTRSSASRRHSPLTRSQLGGPAHAAAGPIS
jgi:hypothetical protein